MVVLAVVLAGAWVIATRTGSPGPGAATLGWHAGAAVLATALQVYADRTPGARGVVAAIAVIALVGTVFAVQWLL